MHHVDLIVYALHLIFDGAATAGGYYARGFCKHTWHRVTLAVVWSMITTYLLVGIIG